MPKKVFSLSFTKIEQVCVESLGVKSPLPVVLGKIECSLDNPYFAREMKRLLTFLFVPHFMYVCTYLHLYWRRPSFALLTSFSHISVRIFLLFTFLLWHSLSSTYFCFTQLSFSQFSPGITQPQLSLTLHNFATHTSALAYFCLSSVFYLNL